MINTINTKQQQLANGYFKIDSGNELILIVGSCRSVPYANYLHEWNVANGNRFTIAFIDPFNFNYDLKDNRVDIQEKINSLETDENMLAMLRSTTIVIHEYYENYGMFCFDKYAEKNIYKAGLNPTIDICIPNFNDRFILFGDIVTFDSDMRKKAIADYNVIGKLSEQTEGEILKVSQNNIAKFYDVCFKSDIPEMISYFREHFISKRLWWTSNHVSKWFTLAIFKHINNKFLHLDLSKGFKSDSDHIDMFANNYTHLTKYDIKWYGYNWGEDIKSLTDKL
jgi:hypothetical protein